MTIIKTSLAKINGKVATVDTVVGKDRNDISYKVNGRFVSYNSFWSKKPAFIG